MRLSLPGVHSRPLRLRLLAAVGAVALGGGLLAVVAPANAAVFTPVSTSPVTVTDGQDAVSAPASLTGAGGLVEDVNVTLNNLTASNPSDLTIKLIGPSGVSVTLLSNSCSAGLSNATLTFDQSAPTAPGASCPTGSSFTPVGQPGNSLGNLNGTDPWGDWKLELTDLSNANNSTATLAGGFTVNVSTGAFQNLLPKTGTSGRSLLYPLNFPQGNRSGTVTDVNVVLKGLSDTAPGDLDVLLVSPKGTAVWVMSDACAGAPVTNVDLIFDDQASGPIPASGPCASGTYRTLNYDGGDPDAMPDPAPIGANAAGLASFNGQNASGVWKLYIADDSDNTATGTYGGGGFLTSSSVNVTTTADLPDTTAPQTKVTHRPKHKVHRHRTHFAFTSSEPGSTFQCKVDHKSWKPCKSGIKVKKLRVHRHRFKVRAIDAAGNVDATPAVVRWRVLSRHAPYQHPHPDTHQN